MLGPRWLRVQIVHSRCAWLSTFLDLAFKLFAFSLRFISGYVVLRFPSSARVPPPMACDLQASEKSLLGGCEFRNSFYHPVQLKAALRWQGLRFSELGDGREMQRVLAHSGAFCHRPFPPLQGLRASLWGRSDSVLDVAEVSGAFGFLHWLRPLVKPKASAVSPPL